MTSAAPDAAVWTCPFCALLCEGFAGPADGAARCARSRVRLEALEAHAAAGADAAARITQAVADAASRLATWRQPLFGGMATDVAGARALYRLAARTGAICDHADGDALMHGVRAVQDRGQYITTIGEVHSRAHTIVFVGTDGVARWPRLVERFGLERDDGPCRSVVFLGAAPPPAWRSRAAAQHLAGSGDLLADVQQLAAWVARKPASPPVSAEATLAALAADLRASPYAVLVWEAGALPPNGALIVERLNSIVGTLNQTTRAATFALGGNDGAASVNQTFTWLSGLPLRTRVSARGLEHDPHRFSTARLLADGAVDGVLWVHSFDATRVPPATALPRVVLGPPAMAARLETNDVFIPVATPGLNADAHLFRTDGPVLLHLRGARDRGPHAHFVRRPPSGQSAPSERPGGADGLMTVAQVACELLRALESAR